MLVAIIAAMAMFAVSLFGWGWGTRRLFAMGTGHAAVTAALGLSVAIFLGGILNVVRLATTPALILVVLAGLVLAVFGLRRDWTALRAAISTQRWKLVAIAVPAFAILAFTVATQLPPSAYNAADDYAKYFFHPLRMLGTGTLYGSPMSDLGSETLGGKAFLDGFVAAFFPLTYLNATDAVFGLFLCLMLAGSFARNMWIAMLCVPSVFLIDPQYMNISALYLGAALVMAAIALSSDPAEMDGGIKPAALGLVYAGIVALKTTFALFVVTHFIFAVVAHTVSRGAGKSAGLTAGVAGWGALFLSPWIILHAPNYFAALAHAPNTLATYGYGPDEGLTLISTIRLTYGSTLVQYTLMMLVAFSAAVSLLWFSVRTNTPQRLSLLMTAAAGFAAFVDYLIMFFVFGWQLSGHGESTRYFLPVAIGAVPAVLGLWSTHFVGTEKQIRKFGFAAVLAVSALPIAIFAPSLVPRIEEAVNEHFILAFPFARSVDYRNLNTLVMSRETQALIHKMQDLVPAGRPLAVWINAPIYLDVRRNPIIDMDSAGLATPWAAFPDSGYIIWEYGGYAMPMARGGVADSGIVGLHERMIAGAELKFSRQLARFAQEGSVLYNDHRFAVIRMPGTAP